MFKKLTKHEQDWIIFFAYESLMLCEKRCIYGSILKLTAAQYLQWYKIRINRDDDFEKSNQ